MKSKPPKRKLGKALLSSRFRYAGLRFTYGHARLYEDRIKLFTLRWRGVHWRTVYLHDIARVVWRTDSEESVNLLLFLHDGGVIPLWMNGSGLWKYWIDERLGKPLSMVEELPQPQAPEPAHNAVSDDRVSVSQADDRVPGQDNGMLNNLLDRAPEIVNRANSLLVGATATLDTAHAQQAHSQSVLGQKLKTIQVNSRALSSLLHVEQDRLSLMLEGVEELTGNLDRFSRMLESVEELTDNLSLLLSSVELDHEGSGLIMNGMNDTNHTK